MTQKLNLRIRHIILSTIIILIGTIHIQAETNELNKTQSDSILISYLKEYGIETTNHNELKLLKSGEEKFIDLFQKIEEAKHHIHLEYFNFRNDSIANTLFELLGKKAQEGVEVRAIFDAFGNASNNQPLKKKTFKSYKREGNRNCKIRPNQISLD